VLGGNQPQQSSFAADLARITGRSSPAPNVEIVDFTPTTTTDPGLPNPGLAPQFPGPVPAPPEPAEFPSGGDVDFVPGERTQILNPVPGIQQFAQGAKAAVSIPKPTISRNGLTFAPDTAKQAQDAFSDMVEGMARAAIIPVGVLATGTLANFVITAATLGVATEASKGATWAAKQAGLSESAQRAAGNAAALVVATAGVAEGWIRGKGTKAHKIGVEIGKTFAKQEAVKADMGKPVIDVAPVSGGRGQTPPDAPLLPARVPEPTPMPPAPAEVVPVVGYRSHLADRVANSRAIVEARIAAESAKPVAPPLPPVDNTGGEQAIVEQAGNIAMMPEAQFAQTLKVLSTLEEPTAAQVRYLQFLVREKAYRDTQQAGFVQAGKTIDATHKANVAVEAFQQRQGLTSPAPVVEAPIRPVAALAPPEAPVAVPEPVVAPAPVPVAPVAAVAPIQAAPAVTAVPKPPNSISAARQGELRDRPDANLLVVKANSSGFDYAVRRYNSRKALETFLKNPGGWKAVIKNEVDKNMLVHPAFQVERPNTMAVVQPEAAPTVAPLPPAGEPVVVESVPVAAAGPKPDQRWFVGRGMNGNVEVTAPSSIEKGLFTHAARMRASMTGQNPRPYPEAQAQADALAYQMGVPTSEIGRLANAYRTRVLDITVGKKQGDKVVAPSWMEATPEVPNADEIASAAKVDARQRTRDGQAVGKGDAQGQAPGARQAQAEAQGQVAPPSKAAQAKAAFTARKAADAPAPEKAGATPGKVAEKVEAVSPLQAALDVLPDIPWVGIKAGTPEFDAVHKTSERLYEEYGVESDKEVGLRQQAQKAKYGSKAKEALEAKVEKQRDKVAELRNRAQVARDISYSLKLQEAYTNPATPPERKLALADKILRSRKEPIPHGMDAYNTIKSEAVQRLKKQGATDAEAQDWGTSMAGKIIDSPMWDEGDFTKQLTQAWIRIPEVREKNEVMERFSALVNKYDASGSRTDRLKGTMPNNREAMLAEFEQRYKAEHKFNKTRKQQAEDAAIARKAEELNKAKEWAAAGTLVWKRNNEGWFPTEGRIVMLPHNPKGYTFYVGKNDGKDELWHVTEGSTGLSAGSGKTRREAIDEADANLVKAGEKFVPMIEKALETTPSKPELQNTSKPKKATPKPKQQASLWHPVGRSLADLSRLGAQAHT
jgi:hypothetical protein